MAEWAGVRSEAVGRLRPYVQVPASHLRAATREILKVKLDPPAPCINSNGILPDYRGLGELADFSDEQIQYFKTKDSPTEEILLAWKHTGTIGQLISFLVEMQRFDIVEDQAFLARIERDGKAWQDANAKSSSHSIQDPCVTTSSDVSGPSRSMDVDENLHTMTEKLKGIKENYTAFVSYAYEDTQFVKQMIKRLENKPPKSRTQLPIKLLIPDRDLLGGSSELTVSADLIEERCHKLVVLISPSYFTSPMCDFLTKFALQLSPGAQKRKIVPVLVQKITQPLPTIIRHINVLDHTKADLVDWFWDRLEASIMETQHWTEESDRPSKEQLENITLRIVPNSAFFTSNSNEDLSTSSSTDPVDIEMVDVQEQASGEQASGELPSGEPPLAEQPSGAKLSGEQPSVVLLSSNTLAACAADPEGDKSGSKESLSKDKPKKTKKTSRIKNLFSSKK